MELSSLNFTNDNKSLEFLSKDNEIILVASSKLKALKILNDMACEKSISLEEFTDFQGIIIENEKFPWSDENKEPTQVNLRLAEEIIGDEIFQLLTSLEEVGIIGLLVTPIQTVSPFYPSSFIPCNCSGKRGIIWTEIGFSTIIGSEETAHDLLNTLRKIGGIDETEIDQIKKQVGLFYQQK